MQPCVVLSRMSLEGTSVSALPFLSKLYLDFILFLSF